MGKKKFDAMPNGHYSNGVMKTKYYFVRAQGTEVWIRILKVDFEALKKSGYRMELDERSEGTYIKIEP